MAILNPGVPCRYNVLLRSGDRDPAGSGEVWGQQYDRRGNRIMQVTSSGRRSRTPQISYYQDFSSILQVGGRLFSVVQFEVGQPAISYLAELDQDTSTGELSVR
eukprot:evm.model.scf_31.1 EVM.evm.TU.scf_31.1   scf_31:26441-28182(-)